jgi:serine phosphatase RsbU (regulator of sigma subunit)
VSNPVPQYLRLYRERADVQPTLGANDIAGLGEFCRAFEHATGWSLAYQPCALPRSETDLLWSAPVNPGVGTTPGHLRIEFHAAADHEEPVIELNAAGAMAGAMATLLSELLRTQNALRQREAELAACVPLVAHTQQNRSLADRLEAVLRSAGEAIGATAGVLYLLDDATTQLHPRSVWNLPRDRFAAGGRPLADAKGDLEALLGHAVTLSSPEMCRQWNAPERFASAMCVPVSSPTMPLGTLWLFNTNEREFSDNDTNIAEMAAGRLAADLEREVLLRAGTESGDIARQLDQAERLQQNQLPRVAPHVEGWELGGWTTQAASVGGDFHDWWVNDDGRLMVVVGDCLDGGLDAALCASSLHATLRALGQSPIEPNVLLERASRSLWTNSAGDQHASLFCASIDPITGRCHFAAAGHIGAIVYGKSGFERLTAPSIAIGIDPNARYLPREMMLEPGQLLIAASDGVHDALDDAGRPWMMSGVSAAASEHVHLSAASLADVLRDRLEAYVGSNPSADRTIVVIKRS